VSEPRPAPDEPAASAAGGVTRRRFLWRSACASVGMTSLASTVFDLQRIAAAAPVAAVASDYKALVCIFLYGGNDANNLVIPFDAADYASYAATRQGLAIPSPALLPINLLSGGDGRQWALHPSLTGMQSLFAQQKMALVANVGPLVAPVTRSDYINHTAALPPQLFSHSDQTTHWQTSLPDQPALTGWGGRVADLLNALNGTPQISMSISLNGANVFQVGRTVTQFQVSSGGPIALDHYTTSTTDASSNALRSLQAGIFPNLFQQTYRDIFQRAIDNDVLLLGLLAGQTPLATRFPATDLGGQLGMIARLVQARAALGQQRQVFFCATGGFDTHRGQLQPQSNLLKEVDDALSAFYAATVEMNVANSVTAFTASDFGRTFLSNGDGSDHGWGSHHLVVGGAVQGGRIYGHMPTLAVNGPDDTADGRWIPTTSVDEYSATLARWLGVSASDMPVVLPNLGRFSTPDLGFMG
jgi:uncharacterized protein (DUF1501 family)